MDESIETLSLQQSLDSEEEDMTSDFYDVGDFLYAVVSDPSLLLYNSLKLEISEPTLKSKIFYNIKNKTSLPYIKNED